MRTRAMLMALEIALRGSHLIAAVDEYNIPSGVSACLTALADRNVSLSDRMNPFYIQTDFDRNGISDYVALISQVSTGKTGFLVCMQSQAGKWTSVRLGAGIPTKLEGESLFDDLGFDAWKIYDGKIPGITGPMIHLIGKEAGSGVFYWRNGRFVWRQLGI